MKKCTDCDLFFEDSIDLCPSCGDRLTAANRSYDSGVRVPERHARPERLRAAPVQLATPEFERRSGGRFMIRGAVAESNTQQFYQSKLAKTIGAVFSGEPYQFSHTSFLTTFRVEEIVQRGFPERAHDVSLYGNMRNLLAQGDEIEIEARIKHGQLTAKRIFNHSTNSPVRMQLQVPASVLRIFWLLIMMSIAWVGWVIASADYAAIGKSIETLLLNLIPLFILIWLGWKILKLLFRGK